MPFKDSLLNNFRNFNPELLLRVVLIFIVGFLGIRILRFFTRKVLMAKAQKQSVMIVAKMITYIGYALLAIIILSEMGIELTALLGAAGIVGLAIGVASQKSLGNIISGLFLVAEKSFEVGDIIKINDKIGVVYSIDFLAIMLKTFDNLVIRIPNETLISAEITNVTRFPIRRLDFVVSVSYKDDLQQAMDVLKSIAVDNVLCLDEPAPFLLLKEFGDSGISIQYGVWFEKDNYLDVRNSVLKEIKRRFSEAGITIPYHQITINMAEDFKAISSS
jgi:small-conductance mechanosensitive channel